MPHIELILIFFSYWELITPFLWIEKEQSSLGSKYIFFNTGRHVASKYCQKLILERKKAVEWEWGKNEKKKRHVVFSFIFRIALISKRKPKEKKRLERNLTNYWRERNTRSIFKNDSWINIMVQWIRKLGIQFSFPSLHPRFAEFKVPQFPHSH